jgi:hypothetical protein
MEDGGWMTEDGGWKMEDGGLTMEDELWTMDDGRWRMGDGGWRMDDGRWRHIRITSSETLRATQGNEFISNCYAQKKKVSRMHDPKQILFVDFTIAISVCFIGHLLDLLH